MRDASFKYGAITLFGRPFQVVLLDSYGRRRTLEGVHRHHPSTPTERQLPLVPPTRGVPLRERSVRSAAIVGLG